MAKSVYIVIACDTDPDRAGFVSGLSNDKLSWQGMLSGIPAAKNRLKELHDDDGKSPVFTWCLRVDHQVETLCGEMDYVLKTHRQFLEGLMNDGDELAWHPHFWKFHEQAGVWYQEFSDKEWQIRMLEKAHEAYRRNFPDLPVSVRMGWDYHSQESFATLDRLGITVEMSAIPGQRLQPKSSAVKASNFYDWYNSPRKAFRPSTADYRRPARAGEQSYATIQYPVFVSRSMFWGLFGSLGLAVKMKDPFRLWYGLKRPSYYMNITGKPRLFAPMISQLQRDLRTRDNVFLINFFHADEVLENNSPLYSLDNMHTNLGALLNSADRLGVNVKFIRARDLKNHFSPAD